MRRKSSQAPSLEEIRHVVQNIDNGEEAYESLRAHSFPTDEAAHELILYYRQFLVLSGYLPRALGKTGGNKTGEPRRTPRRQNIAEERERMAIQRMKIYPKGQTLRQLQILLDGEKPSLHFSLSKIARLLKKK